MKKISTIIWNNGSKLLSDKMHISILYRKVMGRYPNLKNPSTYNEKVNWMKLYDRNPLYVRMADKYEAKKWAASIIGEEHIIPTLGVWDRFEDIDFDSLPQQFVLKCTHDTGSIIICKDKASFDKNSAKKQLNKALKHNHFWHAREWVYKHIKPRIIAEQYVEDKNDGELRDYKFYCLSGEPYSMLLATGRQDKEKGLCFDYFDMEFNHLNLVNHWHPNASTIPHKPDHFEDMKKFAKQLSVGIPQVRADFYEVNGKVLFGEMTFYDMGGCLKIHPDQWDLEWGELIILPSRPNDYLQKNH